MQLQPYLFFNGRCEEAIEFYKKTLGAEIQMLMRNRDAPEPPPPGMLPPGSAVLVGAPAPVPNLWERDIAGLESSPDAAK